MARYLSDPRVLSFLRVPPPKQMTVGERRSLSCQRAMACFAEMEYSIASPDLLTITRPSPLRHQAKSAMPFLPSTRA